MANDLPHPAGPVSGLALAQARLADLRAAGWKPVRLNPDEAARAKPNSLKLAIRAHCWNCVGRDSDPGYMGRVRDCTLSQTCALWPHRPWQNHAGDDNGSEASPEQHEELAHE